MELYDDTLNFYRTFTKLDLQPVRDEGARDGESALPPGDAKEYSTYESSLAARAKAALARFMQNYQANRARMEKERDTRRQQADGFEARREVLDQERTNELGRIEEETGPSSPEYISLESEWYRSRDQLDNAADALKRPVQVYVMPLWYWGLFGFLSTVELPINMLAFARLVGGNFIWAVPLGLGVGALVIFLAHILGILIQRLRRAWSGQNGSQSWKVILAHVAGTALVLWLAVTLIQNLNLVRSLNLGAENLSTRELFLQVNVMVFMVGLALAILAHDPDPDYHQAWLTERRAYKKFLKIKVRHGHKRVGAIRRYDAEMAGLQKEANRARREAAVIERNLENLDRQRRKHGSRVVSVLSEQLLAYQSANERARDVALKKRLSELRTDNKTEYEVMSANLWKQYRPPAYFGAANLRELLLDVCQGYEDICEDVCLHIREKADCRAGRQKDTPPVPPADPSPPEPRPTAPESRPTAPEPRPSAPVEGPSAPPEPPPAPASAPAADAPTPTATPDAQEVRT